MTRRQSQRRQTLVRLVGIALLILGQTGLLIWYGHGVDGIDRSSTVTRGDLLTGDDSFVGRTVVVTGSVVEVSPVYIEITGSGRTVRLRIDDLEPRVSIGDQLRVRGEMVGPGTVSSQAAFAVPRWGLWYVYGVSSVAVVWVLARVARAWRFDRETFSVVPRNRSGRHHRKGRN